MGVPIGPIPIHTMAWYIDEDGLMWVYRGSTLEWIQIVDIGQLIAGGSTASNGLTKVGNDIQLGGQLTKDTNLGINGHTLDIFNARTDFSIDNSSVSMISNAIDLLSAANINTTNGVLTLYGYDVNTGKGIVLELSKNGIIIVDSQSSFGMKYQSDYSAAGTLNDRWIPDWGSVTSLVNALTAANGLYKDGNIIKLGGNPLVEPTLIDAGSNTLNITQTNSSGATGLDLNVTSSSLHSQDLVSSGEVTLLPDVAYLQTTILDNTAQSIIQTNKGGANLLYRNALLPFPNYVSINIGDKETDGTPVVHSIILTDNIRSEGAVYAADYSVIGATNDRWIPDWGAVKGLLTLNTKLTAWTNSGAYSLTSITRDANEAITTATVVWPDGSTGTFTTDTASTLFPGAIDAYHVTYIPSVGATKTITQSLLTRDSSGAVIAQPVLTIV